MKGVPCLAKVVYKGVRKVTSGRSLPVQVSYPVYIFVEYHPTPREYWFFLERHQLHLSTQSSISLGKTFLRASALIWKLAQTWVFTRSFANYLFLSAKFWTLFRLFTHPLRGLSSQGSFIRTCGLINLKGAPSFRQLNKLSFFSNKLKTISYVKYIFTVYD